MEECALATAAHNHGGAAWLSWSWLSSLVSWRYADSSQWTDTQSQVGALLPVLSEPCTQLQFGLCCILSDGLS